MKVIGVNVDAIRRGEDRQEFKDTMARLGIEVPRSVIATAKGIAAMRRGQSALRSVQQYHFRIPG